MVIEISFIIFQFSVVFFAINILKNNKKQLEINKTLHKRLCILENELFNKTHDFNEHL
jgi:energy-converting hydrogenase Eha subunit H